LWRFVAGGFSEDDMSKVNTFRVGKVRAYLRGRVWYLCYHENGRRRRPWVGTDREAARQLAAQVNAQLEVGAPAATSFA
jgi:integrase